MANYFATDTDLTSVANAIRTKGGTAASLSFPSGFVNAIENIPTGGGSSVDEDADVLFIDYDGTVLYSYTSEEFAELTELPQNPSHTGLTAQGWNWTLQNAKAYVASNKEIIIGQTYKTSDEKTKLYIEIVNNTAKTIPLFWYQDISNGVTIDWGDGSVTETVSGVGNKNISHTYATQGKYVINLNVTEGNLYLGGTNEDNCVLGPTTDEGIAILTTLKKVEIGANTGFRAYTFYKCYNLKSITIPNTVQSLYNYLFDYCRSLQNIVLPQGITSISDYCFAYNSIQKISIPISVTSINKNAFNNCNTTKKIIIPTNTTTIGNTAFYYCYCLEKIIMPDNLQSIGVNTFYSIYGTTKVQLPSGITNIDNGAFSGNKQIVEYHIKSTTVPTAGTSIFGSTMRSDCKIYVPYSADHSVLEAYKTATNWSVYASYIQEEPQ